MNKQEIMELVDAYGNACGPFGVGPGAEIRAAIEAALPDVPAVPEIDYEALIAAAYKRDRKWSQGTNGCIAFKCGAEWFRAIALSAAPEPAQAEQPSEPIAEFSDPRVQIVYDLICADESPPNLEEHWDGWVARRIVDALFPAAQAEQPRNEPVQQEIRQCSLCGSDEPFTGTCGGGRNNPSALCYTSPQAQPMSDEQREMVFAAASKRLDESPNLAWRVAILEEVERFHKIGG